MSLEPLSIAKIAGNSRITLTVAVLKHLDARPGDRVAFFLDDEGRIIVDKAVILPSKGDRAK